MDETKSQIKERVKIYSELLRFALVALLATASGIITLFYNANTDSFGRVFTFGFFGNVLLIFEIYFTYYIWREINVLIKKLNQ